MSGIICKVWNIKEASRPGDRKTMLVNSVRYITNEAKVNLPYEMPEDEAEAVVHHNLANEASYLVRDIKTLGGALTGTINLTSVENAVDEMMQLKKSCGKVGGRMALHGTISLPEGVHGRNNAAKLLLMGKDVVGGLFPGHQAVLAVHMDTEHLHLHFVVNSVGPDGK